MDNEAHNVEFLLQRLIEIGGSLFTFVDVYAPGDEVIGLTFTNSEKHLQKIQKISINQGKREDIQTFKEGVSEEVHTIDDMRKTIEHVNEERAKVDKEFVDIIKDVFVEGEIDKVPKKKHDLDDVEKD